MKCRRKTQRPLLGGPENFLARLEIFGLRVQILRRRAKIEKGGLGGPWGALKFSGRVQMTKFSLRKNFGFFGKILNFEKFWFGKFFFFGAKIEV